MIRSFGFGDIQFLLIGLQWTVMLSAIAFVCGAIGGLIIALSRTSGNRGLEGASIVFIEIFQGTPLLMQLFVTYYGLALVGVDVNAWLAAAIGLTLHASAYLGEIWRGSIQAVPKGQSEASDALGLSYTTRIQYVVLPQAFRIGLPATIGFLVTLIKATSLSSIIGFTELARSGQIVSNATYQPLLVFGLVGCLYFCLCWPLSYASTHIEARLARS